MGYHEFYIREQLEGLRRLLAEKFPSARQRPGDVFDTAPWQVFPRRTAVRLADEESTVEHAIA